MSQKTTTWSLPPWTLKYYIFRFSWVTMLNSVRPGYNNCDATPHAACAMLVFVNETCINSVLSSRLDYLVLMVEVMSGPPLSPDLNSCDIFLQDCKDKDLSSHAIWDAMFAPLKDEVCQQAYVISRHFVVLQDTPSVVRLGQWNLEDMTLALCCHLKSLRCRRVN
jgi:hypothetical protein